MQCDSTNCLGFVLKRVCVSLAPFIPFASHSKRCHRSSLSLADPSAFKVYTVPSLGIMDMGLPEDQSLETVMKQISKSKSAATSLPRIKHKILKRSSESPLRQRSHKNSTKKTSNEKSDPKITCRDQKKHRALLSILPNETRLSYISKGKELLTGHTQGNGIYCHCCNKVVSPTMFENHAGRTSSKKPYQHIFLPQRMSLHEYASTLELNDLQCSVCHKECVSDTITNLKKRLCKQCQLTVKCVLPKADTVKDGRVSEVDPQEQSAKQRVQIDSSCAQIACVLCRSHEFTTDGFNDQTSIVCDQCEKEYHIGCLRKEKDIVLKKLPPDNWFCTDDCRRLYSLIDFLLEHPLMVKDSYLQLVKNKFNGSDAETLMNLDVKWHVFKGKDACNEKKLLLTQAINMLHDCFDPIIDSVTGEDFIPSMAYGRQMGSSNFSGVYSALLTIGTNVITAGMFRAFGREFVELSVVATSKPYQRKGYFQLFFKCFVRLLSYIRIKKLVIPAADNAKVMWTQKFGFTEVPPETLAVYREIHTSMVAFQGTTLLERAIPQGLVTSLYNGVIC